MSRLQKAIARIQKAEGPRLGFGPSQRERPPAMLAGAVAGGAKQAAALASAGAEVLLVDASDAKSALQAVTGVSGVVVGVRLPTLDSKAASAFKDSAIDFVVAEPAATAAGALEPDGAGYVPEFATGASEALLRAVGSLGVDALYVALDSKSVSVAGQLELIRLSGFASTPLMVVSSGVPEAGELRALRDSGVACVLLGPAATANDLRTLAERIKSLPPKKRREGGEMAVVPGTAAGRADEDDEDDD